MDDERLDDFQKRVLHELLQNILPFWQQQVVDPQGEGFYARISNDLQIKERSPKGLILNARILWTFSAAFSRFQQSQYLQIAQRAYQVLQRHFWDHKYGGMFWLLDADNQPLDVSKKIYGQAFAIYSLSEYYHASNDQMALQQAQQLFHLIEKHNYDEKYGGYFETSNRDWTPAEDVRLSEIDLNEKKSMNTHLHLLEAYTHLYRFWPDASLKRQLSQLIDNFLQHILDPTTLHFHLFFDEQWQVKSDRVSFGHDIEGSWLLIEAANILGDRPLYQKIVPLSLGMTRAVLDEAMTDPGGIVYERDGHGRINTERHWWPQAEALVGFVNAYQLSGEQRFFEAAEKIWRFCEDYLVDRQHGEWFYKILPNGKPDQTAWKVSEWKCPYHNSRACMEVHERMTNLKGKNRISKL